MSSTLRIMPLGDSITEGFRDASQNGGYRGPLAQKIANAGFAADFIGSLSVGGIGVHEGDSGKRADQIAANVYARLVLNPPDVVLLHIGTNSILQRHSAADITNDIAQILNNIDSYEKASRSRITVILAQIVNQRDPTSPMGLETTALNRSIAVMAAARIADGDRLIVVNLEPVLSYPSDLADDVHPKTSGYGKMAEVWFRALEPLLRNRTIPPHGYTLDVLTGLAVDKNGFLEMTSVVDMEFWKPLTKVGDAVFTAGAPVAMAKQNDGVLTAMAVDKYGQLAVASVGGAGIWQSPVGISGPIFLQGTPVAMAKQTDGVLTALAVDKDGRLVVTSVGGLGIWQPTVGISDTIFPPLAPVAMAKQNDGVLTALAVNKGGRLMVTSVGGLGVWQPPVGISDTIFLPGTPVAMAKQTDGVLTALAVDKDGRLVVTSVGGLGTWQPTVGISDAIFPQRAPIAMAKQTDGVLTALAVDNSGRLMVMSVGGLGIWQPPVGISGPDFLPRTHIAMSKQTDGVLTALAVDKHGRLVVASVPGLGTWQLPVGISSAIFPPGAPVALTKQIDAVNLCAFIKAQHKHSGSSLTQRIGQLTGKDEDPEYRHARYPQNVFNETASHGVAGTDLGANAEFEDKLVFYFGDVPTAERRTDDQSDWVAFTSDPAQAGIEPLTGFTLTSVDGPDGSFHPFSIKGVGPLGIAQTPTGAFSYPVTSSRAHKARAYVFAFYNPADSGSTPYPPGSLLTKSSDPTKAADFDFVLSFSTFAAGSGRFFQVAPWVVNNAEFPGLFPSSEGDGLVLMGQGGPANNVHMAWMPLFKGIDPDLATIQYYCGSGCPERWSPREGDAKSLFSTIGYTSLSLAWIPGARRWLLLYTLASPGAVPLHYDARSPTQHNPNGPVVARLGVTPWDWSDEIIVFDPLRENALGKFMHRPGCGADGDGLEEVAPVLPAEYDNAYAGEPSYAYGPFLLNRYTRWDPTSRGLTIFYLMSTFRPYQVHLMRSQFDVPPDRP